MSSSYQSLPPAFVPISGDTAEMFSNGRTLSVTHSHLSGEVRLATYASGLSSHNKFTRAEALALVAELQRVLALPVEQAA